MSRFLISPFFIISLFLLILVLHILAMSFGWYWKYDNIFDNLHHFLGGFWVAAVFFYVFKQYPQIFDTRKNWLATLILALGFVALVGVAWEFFEFTFDRIFADKEIFPRAQISVADTMADLFFNLVGGLLFIFVIRYL